MCPAHLLPGRNTPGNYMQNILHALSSYTLKISYYTELMGAGVLEPFTSPIYNFRNVYQDTKHFVAPAGMSSVVKFFLNKSGCKPQFNHHISCIEKSQGQW